jgi:Xaa-Pro dipeptidase
MRAVQDVLEPGGTENALWAELHRTNIANGGEWIETKLLSSGHRTNPWFQDAADKPVSDGEFMAFDTDMIGPNGYLADVSRTLLLRDQAAIK